MRNKEIGSASGFISATLSAVLLTSCAVKISSSEPAEKVTAKPALVATAIPTAVPTPEPTAAPTPKTLTSVPATAAAAVQPEAEPVGSTYILNTNTKKIHLPACASVSKMKDKNKREIVGTIDEAKAQGYEPCKQCIGN